LDSGTPAGGGWCAFLLFKADKKIAEKPFFLFDLCRFIDTLLPSEIIFGRGTIRKSGFERRMKK
jgi:hypothetical protein